VSWQAVIFACLVAKAALAGEERAQPPAEERALAYLAREVPRWSRENKCFSCHNNGDAARALYGALRLKFDIDPESLADTSAWLARPHVWRNNGGEGEFNDRTLAAVQFAASLAAATRADAVKSRQPLAEAAALVAGLQQPDGSWRIDGPDTIGAPATWGRTLLTANARHVLQQANSRRFQQEIERADAWLRTSRPQSVLDAAAALIGLGSAADAKAAEQRSRCLALIQQGEAKTGGWGPYRLAPPEPFDTAVVLIALTRSPATPETAALIGRGRRFLLESQLPAGNWPETTRPADATSYAQRLSTTGWAAEALLATRRETRDSS
jgi:hypothetical protein